MTPAPTIPHTVEVDTVIRNWPEAFSPRDVALTGHAEAILRQRVDIGDAGPGASC